MKLAVVGSRGINAIPLEKYVTEEVDEIVSGGAVGVDTCAADFAKANGLKLTVFLPEYHIYGRSAPIKRNKQIVDYADAVIAFWDGSSRGTSWVIEYAKQVNKPCRVLVRKL